MAKPYNSARPYNAGAKATAKVVEEAPPSHAVRETVESIVIAFVLAFLFRTFEAEAFVIPTGSMAPTLMGRHKDVDCPKCGHRYRVTASDEQAEQYRTRIREIDAAMRNPELTFEQRTNMQGEIDRDRRFVQDVEIVGGVCPVCRYAMPMAPGLNIVDTAAKSAEAQTTFNGDRILVNKYLYTVTEPKRWDVIVFHFPGDAEVNYIKRLVGLPNETLRIYEGDLFVGPTGAKAEKDFEIARKPADKVLAVRQLVHDTDYDPAELFAADWPLRWRAESPTGADGWQRDAQVADNNVHQKFTVDRTHGGEAWLRYHHWVPNNEVWDKLALLRQKAPPGAAVKFSDEDLKEWRPELIMDFNAYNTCIQRGDADNGRGDMQSRLWPDIKKLGMHWVGDLMVEADVEVVEAKGQLLLDLVEAGKHFTASIDLTTGKATLGIADVSDFAPTANTPISAPGKYHVAFANVDDQLLLWVGRKLVKFDKETTYDAVSVFGSRNLKPKTSTADRGDLAPAGIGARDSKLAITRLQLWRDIYYIADTANRPRATSDMTISDYDRITDRMILQMRSDPSTWEEFPTRLAVDFPLGPDQFFVMGDNSPESSDARLWSNGRPGSGIPGGAYLERKLLIGKAIYVYWPHAWYSIPYTPFPIWPNFWDMRLVR